MVWFWCVLMTLVGCTASRQAVYPEASYGGIGTTHSDSDYRARPKRSMGTPPAPPMAAPPPAPVQMSGQAISGHLAEPSGVELAAEPEEPQQSRMVHYNGHIRLRVTDSQETLATLKQRAEEGGGYVEQLASQRITLRIPVADFRSFFEEILGLGDVMDKSMSAQDVTEAYTSMDLRLRTANKTRARLQRLLSMAEEEEEKLRLLREIRRLTEQIDQIEAQVSVLARLAQFSRITVEVVPRNAFQASMSTQSFVGFAWIGQLSPFSRSVQFQGKKYKMPAPEGFVALTMDDSRHFAAESADGAVVWSSRRPNNPKGDADYWAQAIVARFAQDFETLSQTQRGDYSVARFLEPGKDPYVYEVAVRTQGKWLVVVETYFPSEEHEARHRAAVDAVLAGGAS